MHRPIAVFFTFLISALPAWAEEFNCDSTGEGFSQIEELAGSFTSPISDTSLCFDVRNYQTRKDLLEDFKLLDTLGAFDAQGCLRPLQPEANKELVSRFIQKNLEHKPLTVVAAVNPATNEVNVIYTPSDDAKFRENALTRKDKWQIAAGSIGGIVIGAVLSEKMYPGEEDKRKHWIYGAAISGVTSGVTYLVLEKTDLFKNLHFSRQDKKNLITYTGPLMSLVIGVAKEVLYDKKRPKKHTVDGNDAAATALGGGLISPLVINIVF